MNARLASLLLVLILAAFWWMGEGLFGFFIGLNLLDVAGDVLELILKLISEASSG